MNKKKIKAYLYQRFSSEQQLGNSSLFRQTEAQNFWLNQHPEVEVVEKLIDKAMSGFKGTHLKKGSLGRLVTEIGKGNIEKGSLILVEHFSRLSRLNHDETEILLKKIWDGDITIITVRDGYEYPPSSINNIEKKLRLMFEIDKAHSDSKWRSDKAKAVHSKKRIEAKKGITPKIRKPFWLNKEGNLNEYAPAVKDMFELYHSGLGQVSILKKLQTKYPNFTPIQKMSPPTVIRCITNPIAIGYWQETKVYEACVAEKIFFDVQKIHKHRLYKNVMPDRKWPLSGLIKCGYCNKGMSIQQTKKSLPLLRCSNMQRIGRKRSKCKSPTTFPYVLADHFLRFHVIDSILNQLTIKQNNEKNNIKINKLENMIDIEQQKLSKLHKKFNEFKEKNESLDMIIDLMQESTNKLSQSKQQKLELKSDLTPNFEYDISKEMFELYQDSEALNLALHKINFRIILTGKRLTYNEKWLEYKGYNKKEHWYCFNSSTGTGFVPTDGLKIESLLNSKPKKNTLIYDVIINKWGENYQNMVKKVKNGEKVSSHELFKFPNPS